MKQYEGSADRDALRSNVLFRRAQKRLSQTALAERSNVSRPVISELENGRGNATLDVLSRIASALETNVADLLTQQVNPGNSDSDIERRAMDGDEAYVDADAFLEALDDRTPAKQLGNRIRRRKAAVQTPISS